LYFGPKYGKWSKILKIGWLLAELWLKNPNFWVKSYVMLKILNFRGFWTITQPKTVRFSKFLILFHILDQITTFLFCKFFTILRVLCISTQQICSTWPGRPKKIFGLLHILKVPTRVGIGGQLVWTGSLSSSCGGKFKIFSPKMAIFGHIWNGSIWPTKSDQNHHHWPNSISSHEINCAGANFLDLQIFANKVNFSHWNGLPPLSGLAPTRKICPGHF